jgi:hypothetical protein
MQKLTLVSEKNAIFFAENCQKSPKILILTSTPGTKWSSLLFFAEASVMEQRFVFSAKVDAKALFAYEKKVPEFTLMGQ